MEAVEEIVKIGEKEGLKIGDLMKKEKMDANEIVLESEKASKRGAKNE